ncbi:MULTISPECIES: S8 family serine peptidase [Idiomarina]|jgi:subtilisin family serine protease/subtilisin-like proprotein convertase family protein|uniref:S8 family serine peptidase n=1 Tax=Idiomarina TaxID=135575 RepID=UPI000C4F07E0|nr:MULTISPECIES: S8 family serine peptidase [Idiomarina]MAO68913.1 peptidase S8 [Idiomarina sp.]MBF81039.1 peptidase S8 [Idiomarina sp.]|tara:strand:+ start:4755 stop:7286 length:2532 start_codon:yes stop_codon:yes gene_type:complete
MTNLKKLVVGVSMALAAGTAAANSKQADDDSLLVVFKASATKEQRLNLISNAGGTLRALDNRGRDMAMRNIADGRIAKVNVRNAKQRDALIKRLSNHPLVDVAEPNYIISINDTKSSDFNILATPDDPAFGDMWALENTGQSGGTPGVDIDARPAWDITTGDSTIVIGVIDSGVDYTHPDLAGNMWVNPGEVCDNGQDDDGNGVVDDCYGYSAVNSNGDPMDENGHGTHVAGTIGASSNNGEGVTGVNWDVEIVGCQFLDASGSGSTAAAIECIDYMTNLKVNHGVNLVATNNSWGGGAYSESLRTAISDSIDEGIMFVSAAGNDGIDSDVTASYPGGYDLDGIVNVANTTRTDSMAASSTYGAVSVDLGAPGTEILSTYLNGGYATASGTSMASPHVAGVAGLVWSIAPHLTVAEVKQILMDSGESNPALAGKTVSGNRLNALSALEAADPDPAYRLTLSPVSQEIVAGDNATLTLDVGSIADWSGTVDLTVSSEPQLDVSLSSDQAQNGESVDVQVATTEDTAWGEYAITVNGTDVETGEMTRDVSASVYVLPQGLSEFYYDDAAGVDIPDDDSNGITRVINVPDTGVVFGADVSVDITHTWRGDLIVTLTSPEGTEHVLHDRTGGSEDDLVQSWSLDSFNGEDMTGDWTLNVSDNAGADTGVLNHWSLTLTAVEEDDGLPDAPVAGFEADAADLTVSFTNTSTDRDGDIESYFWEFGDGSTSTETNPVYAYSQEGTYDVTLTVTDATELSDTVTQSVTVSLTDIELDVYRSRLLRSGTALVDLRWSGAAGDVDLYRNGEFVETLSNSGRARDRFDSDGSDVVYKLCEAGTEACDSVTVSF